MTLSHCFFVYFWQSVRLVLLIILLTNTLLSYSQEIRGKVIDADSKESIPFANAFWVKNQVGAIADFNGVFQIGFYENDTLIISSVGLSDLRVPSNEAKTKKEYYLSASAQVLADVQIKVKRRKRRKRKEDPAYLLHKAIAENRDRNNLKEKPHYECDIYNKVEIDLNNVDSNTKDLLLFKPISFVFDNPDTTSLKKPFAPIFLSEGFSNYYFKNPNKEKEVILASKNAGISVPSLAQYTGNVYTDFNIYANYIRIFQMQFISPLAKTSWLSYKYYITDSIIKGDTTFYRLDFKPRREQDLAFEGYLITDNVSHGVSSIQYKIPKRCNINYVEEFVIEQKYTLLDSTWVLSHEKLVIDVNPMKKVYGFYIQKNTDWLNYEFNKERGDDFFSTAQKTFVTDSAYKYGDQLLKRYRPVELDTAEKNTYTKVDSAMNTRYLKVVQNLSQMVYTGYYPFKYWEYGPYYTTYSFNSLEGQRLRLGFQTTQSLFENWRLRGYAAHGFDDEVTKYSGVVTKFYGFKKWRYFEFEHLNDYKILSASDNAFQEDNILASLTRRVDPKYTHTIRSRFAWSHEWYNGINNSLELKTEKLIPIGSLTYKTPLGEDVNELNVHTVKVGGRFALNEKFVRYGFRRLSLLTTKPRFDYGYTYGLKIQNQGFEFHKLELQMADRYYFGFFGFLDLRMFAGKIWGDLPYPLLLNHQGNDSYYFDSEAFNLMNPFEFVSDQQVSLMAKYNFNGLLLNRVPLLKRMHLRSFVFANSVYGTLNDGHENLIELPEGLSALSEPYLETGFGIENIFKLIRLDFIWRLTNSSSPEVQQFGITFDIVPAF